MEIYRTLEALLVIHNIMEDLEDDPTAISDFGSREDVPVEGADGDTMEVGLTGNTDNTDLLRAQGVYRQKELVEYFCHQDQVNVLEV